MGGVCKASEGPGCCW